MSNEYNYEWCQERVPETVQDIIDCLGSIYQDTIDKDVLDYYKKHGQWLLEHGMSLIDVEDTLGSLFWKAAQEFGA